MQYAVEVEVDALHTRVLFCEPSPHRPLDRAQAVQMDQSVHTNVCRV